MNSAPRGRGRPKKSGSSNQDTRVDLIQAGLAMLTETGYLQSSVDTILRTASIPKGSFYHHFASKEAFGLAVLEAYQRYFLHKLRNHLLNQQRAPLDGLQDFIDDACLGMARYGFKRGCLVGNLEQEVTQLPSSFRLAIRAIYTSWQTVISECLERAKELGDIATEADSTALSMTFWIGWEGAVSRARLMQSDAPLRHFGHYFIEQLTATLGARS